MIIKGFFKKEKQKYIQPINTQNRVNLLEINKLHKQIKNLLENQRKRDDRDNKINDILN